MGTAELYYDQYDYAIDDNPYEIWQRLQDEAPVWYNEKYQYWVLTRYDDVMKALLDWQTFSSAWGTTLEAMGDESSQSTMMIFNDPPYHDQLRAVVAPHFTPARVAQLESEVRQIVTGYLEPLEKRDSFDFVQDFGRWVPMDVVSSLLGIPVEDRRQINQWADDILHREEGNPGLTEVGMRATGALNQYFSAIMRDRRESPRDDLLTVLACGELELEDGTRRPFSERESFEFMLLIAAAGNETVARLLGNAGVLLARHPEQRAKLRENPSLIPRAIEELLRYEAPSPVQFRRAMKDVEMHGVTIREGDKICLLNAAATRDQRQWQDGDEFDIERPPKRHLTFGYGVHTCLGSSVARLESRIALEEVLARIGDWAVDEAGLQRVRTSTVRGYSHVPVKIIAGK